MLQVHIWLPHGNLVGHTSLSFGNNYVSFWPEDGASKKDLKIKRSHPGQFMAALQEDIRNEGGCQPSTITIPQINEDKLSQHIAILMSDTPRYQLVKNNCSNIIAECLKIASGKEPSFYPSARDYGKLGKVLGRGIWTPNEVLRFAHELAAPTEALVCL